MAHIDIDSSITITITAFLFPFLLPLPSPFHPQGVELGPLEIQMNSLHKSIEAEMMDIQELQQHWLKDQSELVQLTKETDMQAGDVDQMKKKITILAQKKLRIEGE
jgi:hypothetical protein